MRVKKAPQAEGARRSAELPHVLRWFPRASQTTTMRHQPPRPQLPQTAFDVYAAAVQNNLAAFPDAQVGGLQGRPEDSRVGGGQHGWPQRMSLHQSH